MKNLSLKRCLICDKRGDRISKNSFAILKTENDPIKYAEYFNKNRNSWAVNDIVCLKHSHKMMRDEENKQNNDNDDHSLDA